MAESKLTSEQRCKRAFLGVFQLSKEDFEALGLSDEEWTSSDLWMGWRACWRYLQERVSKEFIER